MAVLVLAACDNSDDEERLAAQRLFRNVLMQADDTAAADVRIQGFVDTLPPDFPPCPTASPSSAPPSPTRSARGS